MALNLSLPDHRRAADIAPRAVLAGLVPAIHAVGFATTHQKRAPPVGVGGRDKPGQDGARGAPSSQTFFFPSNGFFVERSDILIGTPCSLNVSRRPLIRKR